MVSFRHFVLVCIGNGPIKQQLSLENKVAMNVEWNDNADNFCSRSAIETHRLINTKQYQQIPLESTPSSGKRI